MATNVTLLIVKNYFYSLKEMPLPDVGEDEIEVEMLLAAVNPSDINQIQGILYLSICHYLSVISPFVNDHNYLGTYPLKPPLPAVGGNEGVGVVRRCGKNVTLFGEGDWVMPVIAGVGMYPFVFIHPLFFNIHPYILRCLAYSSYLQSRPIPASSSNNTSRFCCYSSS